jgi:ribose transport system ATP-binding protein
VTSTLSDVPRTPPVLLGARGIRKSFDGVRVLHGIDFELRQGEVHGIIGQNGAGKSTLVKILSGAYTADEGVVEINESPVVSAGSTRSRRGIAMVFQEFSLVPTMTVGQNILLGREPKHWYGLIDDAATDRIARAALEQVGSTIDPRTLVANLPVGSKQLVEIAKAMSQDARILILDEPTASLATAEIRVLTGAIERLTASGIGVIYISHHLDEVVRICDRVTVLRNGQVILTSNTSDVTLSEIIEAMLGRSLESALVWQPHEVDRTKTPLLRVSGLSNDRLDKISFELHQNEVLGVAGLLGSGRTELVRALFGIDRVASGVIEVDGRPVRVRSPGDAIASGIALVPEDRARTGLVGGHAVDQNMLMAAWDRFSTLGIVRDQEASSAAQRLVDRLGIRTASLGQAVRRLSGGNQQKVVVAKNLSVEPRILLLDDPTVGIDIGSKREILMHVRDLARVGNGVLLISSELEELSGLADRVLVMHRGRLTRAFDRSAGDDLSVDALSHAVQETNRADA